MKKLTPYILMLAILVNILAPFSVGLNNGNLEINKNVAKAAGCTVNDNWIELNGTRIASSKTKKPSTFTLVTDSTGCVGKDVAIVLFDHAGTSRDPVIFSLPYTVTKNKFSLELKAVDGGLENCHNSCDLFFKVFVFEDKTDPTDNSEYQAFNALATSGTNLEYNCSISPCKAATDFSLAKMVQSKDGINDDGPQTNGSVYGHTYFYLTSVDDKLTFNIQGIDYFLNLTNGTNNILTDGKGTHNEMSLIYDVKDDTGKSVPDKNGSVDIKSLNFNKSRYKLDLDTFPKGNYKVDWDLQINVGTIASPVLIDIKDSTALQAISTAYSTGIGNATNAAQTSTSNSDNNDFLPPCEGISDWDGCAARLFYYAVFIPTSYLFGFAGIFFDYTFGYSISDQSYRGTDFVVKGWGIVRDFCNVFFIFILIYAAFSMILGLHSPNGKKILMNVIIVGLLINFSFFFTEVIIDAGNILARVFYNSNAVAITLGQSGTGTSTGAAHGGINLYNDAGPGNLPLSAGIVGMVNPQEIIINANKVTITDNAANGGAGQSANAGTDKKDGGLGTGGFFLVTLMAVIVNLVGFFVFLSIGLIFVARVIGLWFAVIFAPFAFLSITIPSLEKIKQFGWKSWLSETTSMAFLAPIFMFFLYLILLFLGKAFKDVVDPSSTGVRFVLGVIVPFAFIMIMLWKAKGLAKDMSGGMGQMITGAITAAAGLALGGAALTVAAIGRGTAGSFMKGAATGDTAADRLRSGNSRNFMDGVKGVVGFIPNLGQRAIRGRLNRDQTRVEGYAHARQELDTATGRRFHGKKWGDLTQPERTIIRQRISRDHEGERVFGRRYDRLTDVEKTAVDGAVNPQLVNNTTFADTHFVNQAWRKQGLVSKVVQSSRNGSYDVRNLSKVVANEYDRGFSKLMSGLTSTLAGGLRGGLKNITNLNYGEGQKEKSFLKDLGHTISESMKSAKINVNLSHVGDEKKEGQGGDHH